MDMYVLYVIRIHFIEKKVLDSFKQILSDRKMFKGSHKEIRLLVCQWEE